MITRWKLVRAALDATSKLLHAHALTDGDEGDDTLTSAEPNATFVQQLGVAARPVIARTLRALGVEHGAEVLLLKVWDKTKLPASLDEGETQVFACGDVTVRLRMRTTGVTLEAKDATVTITSDGDVQISAPNPRTISLNGGSTPIAKEGSLTTGHTHTATFALTAPAGGGPVTGTITIVSATDTIATGAGSQRARVL